MKRQRFRALNEVTCFFERALRLFWQRNVLLAFPVTLSIVCATTLAQNVSSSLSKRCSDPHRQLTLTENEVLRDRYPDASRLNVSSACKEAARKKVEGWRQEDRANWEQLSNRACSHALGWIEKVPGTCQAGGPPPICPVDHWIQRPAIAWQLWKDKQKEELNKREAQLMSEACQCYTAELEAGEAANRSAAYPPASVKPYSDFAIVPCTGSECPPGFECKAGICRPLTARENAVNKARETVVEKAKEKATDKVLEKVEEVLSKKAVRSVIEEFALKTTKLVTSTWGQVVIGVFEAPPLGLNTSGYKSSVEAIGYKINKLGRLYDDLIDQQTIFPSRSQRLITDDILKLKAQLREDLTYLNEWYRGVVKERELCKYCCYEAFRYQHSLVTQSIVKAISLPENFQQ